MVLLIGSCVRTGEDRFRDRGGKAAAHQGPGDRRGCCWWFRSSRVWRHKCGLGASSEAFARGIGAGWVRSVFSLNEGASVTRPLSCISNISGY